MQLTISNEVRETALTLKVVLVEADIINRPTSVELCSEIEAASRRVRDTFALGQINKRPTIAATRAAYKTLGKEPNRFRPSAKVNNLLLSILYGNSC